MTEKEIKRIYDEVWGAWCASKSQEKFLHVLAREIERLTLERARLAVDAEHLEEEADNPSDAAYQCAVDDCVQAIGALMEQVK